MILNHTNFLNPNVTQVDSMNVEIEIVDGKRVVGRSRSFPIKIFKIPGLTEYAQTLTSISKHWNGPIYCL